MHSNQKVGRIVGALFLFVFISGITMYQFLQGEVLFSTNYLVDATANANELIISILLGVFSGIVSIMIAILLLPIFKRHSIHLAFLYLAFCILNFITIMMDNMSVISMLEFSQEYLKNGEENSNSLQLMSTLIYEKHWWTHHLFLLVSCFPVFVLYLGLFRYQLVPRVLSIVGMIAAILMLVEVLCAILGNSISMNLMIPIALIQLVLPLWLIFKGLNASELEKQVNN